MTNVITQIELMKYSGMDRINFPAGTILTPSASDWAREHNILVTIGEGFREKTQSMETDSTNNDKDILLKRIVESALKNMKETGALLSKDELEKTVTACLVKLGCQVVN